VRFRYRALGVSNDVSAAIVTNFGQDKTGADVLAESFPVNSTRTCYYDVTNPGYMVLSKEYSPVAIAITTVFGVAPLYCTLWWITAVMAAPNVTCVYMTHFMWGCIMPFVVLWSIWLAVRIDGLIITGGVCLGAGMLVLMINACMKVHLEIKPGNPPPPVAVEMPTRERDPEVVELAEIVEIVKT
jgi:hypothetical protein